MKFELAASPTNEEFYYKGTLIDDEVG